MTFLQIIKAWIDQLARGIINRSDFFYRQLRAYWPIPVVSFGGKSLAIMTLADDVEEVLHEKDVFNVPYEDKIRTIMGGGNVFLGKDQDPERVSEKLFFRDIMPAEDAVRVAKPEVERLANDIVDRAGGRIDVVRQLTQEVTTLFFGKYFGLPGPVDVQTYSDWARLLFEFQFVDRSNDPDLRKKVDLISARLRDYVDEVIATRKVMSGGEEDLLGRCLNVQKAGAPLTDEDMRNNLIAFIVGGLPQPPMIVPQLMDVLLNRPQELAAASQAAKADDDALLSRYVFEALRFYPLTPGLFRHCASPFTIASGTRRQKTIPAGATVLALTRSAMFDDRVLHQPQSFLIDRPEGHYMHFGWGPHLCFGIFVNQQIIPMICKSLLKRDGLRRADGGGGRLTFDGVFARKLEVTYR